MPATYRIAMNKRLVGLTRLEDGNDVGVVDRRCELGLAEESLAEPVVPGKSAREELQRHLALQSQVLGQVHDAHAAATEQVLDAIAGDLCADPGVVADVHGAAPVQRAGTIGRTGARA